MKQYITAIVCFLIGISSYAQKRHEIRLPKQGPEKRYQRQLIEDSIRMLYFKLHNEQDELDDCISDSCGYEERLTALADTIQMCLEIVSSLAEEDNRTSENLVLIEKISPLCDSLSIQVRAIKPGYQQAINHTIKQRYAVKKLAENIKDMNKALFCFLYKRTPREQRFDFNGFDIITFLIPEKKGTKEYTFYFIPVS